MVCSIQHSIPQINGGIKAYSGVHESRHRWLVSKSEDMGGSPAAPIVCPVLGQRYQHLFQCCADIQPSFRCTNSVFVFVWNLRNVNTNVFKNPKILKKKVKSWSDHYLKKKLMSHGTAFKKQKILWLQVISCFINELPLECRGQSLIK